MNFTPIPKQLKPAAGRRCSIRAVLLLGLLLLVPSLVLAQQLAFPTAEGYGRFAQGGRGGSVIYITRLDGNTTGYTPGNGSLRACLEATGARTCIFRVGGIIDWPLESPTINPYLTLAGQTAPGDGIMIKGLQFQMRNTHDIILRHLRVRPGGSVPVPQSWGAIEIVDSHDIIVDHFSTGWATDDTLAVADSRNITYQWGIVSEGLSKTDANKVALTIQYTTGGPGTYVSHLHNLFANHVYRAPSINTGSHTHVVNTVIYNTVQGSQLYPAASNPANAEAATAEFVNNYYKWGPNSRTDLGTAILTLGCGYDAFVSCSAAANSKIYLSGNYHSQFRPNNTLPETSLLFQQGNPHIPVSSTPLGFPAIPSQTDAQQARTDVLAKVGARVPQRDAIDTRAVNDVINGTGNANLTDESQVGGYPVYNSGTPYTDTDGDGISDAWETAHGLNPNNAADGPALAAGQPAGGYTNLEVFLNELAGDTPPAPVVTITAPPTTTPPYSTATTPLTTLAGTATDTTGVSSLSVSCSPACGSPTVNCSPACGGGTPPTSVTWSVASLPLTLGTNVVTVTGTNPGAQSGSDAVTVTLTGPPDTTTGLVAWWKLNEVSGTADDSSPNNNLGTLNGGATYVTSQSNYGRALSLVAAGDGLTVPDDPSLDMTGAFSVTAWVNPSSAGTSWRTLVTKNGSGFNTYFLNAYSDCAGNAPQGGHSNGTTTLLLCDPTPLSSSTWTHLAYTFDGTTAILYRNGVAVATGTTSAQPVATTGTLQLGKNQFGHQFLGLIDAVHLYNRALTATDVPAVRDQTEPLGGSAPPTVTITTPTSGASWSTATTPLTVAGTATDDVSVANVAVSCTPSCGTPSVTGTTSWSSSVPLQTGNNVVRVTATDGDAQTAVATLTVTYTPVVILAPGLYRVVK